MSIQEIKRELKLTNKDLAYFFGYKTAASYANSHNKERIEIGICFLYDQFKKVEQQEKPKNRVKP